MHLSFKRRSKTREGLSLTHIAAKSPDISSHSLKVWWLVLTSWMHLLPESLWQMLDCYAPEWVSLISVREIQALYQFRRWETLE